jgi:hypothetical protein
LGAGVISGIQLPVLTGFHQYRVGAINDVSYFREKSVIVMGHKPLIMF